MKSFVNIFSRNWRWTALSIFIAAVLFRGAFVLTLQDGFYFPDSVEYSQAAVNLLTNGELGESYHRPPGYPVFLAGIYVFFGESILAVRMVESVLGALLAVIIALIGKRVGGETVGVLAGVLWSIYPIGVFIVGLVYPTHLLTMLLACGVLLVLPSSDEDCSHRKFFLAGVTLGLATLTVPAVLASIGVISLYISRIGHGKRGFALLFFVLGSTLTIVPWAIRDFYVYGRIVPVEPRVIQHLPRIESANGNVSEEKVRAILEHPVLFASHFGSEFLHFWKLYPDRIQMDSAEARQKAHEKDPRVVNNTLFTTNNVINTVSVLSTGPLFLFAMVGTAAMVFRRELRRYLFLLWGTILSFAVVYSIFYTKTRYRIPIEPYIVILSAYGIKQTWDLVEARFSEKQVKHEVEAEARIRFS